MSDGDHPYCGNWWVPGLQLGYEHSFVHAMVEFIRGLESGKGCTPNFKDGLATDYVVDAGDGSDNQVLMLGYGSLYNHSDDPNAEYTWEADDAYAFTALRDIDLWTG